MAKHSFNKTVWQCLTLISQFGIMMLVPTGMMFALGYWLDGRLGTQFLQLCCFCWRFGGIWEYLSAGAANLSEEGQKGQGMRNFSKRSMKPSGRCGSALFVGMSVRAGVRLVGKGQAVQRSWHPDRDAACHGRNLAHVEGAGYSAGARGRRTEICDVEESSPVCCGFGRVCSPDADTFCRPSSGVCRFDGE